MYRKAIIIGIKGTKLTKKEKNLIKNEKPWGIILFSRNISDIYQVKDLISDIRYNINDKNYPILIDEEGGGVSRLNKIFDFKIFSQEYFSKLYTKNKKFFFYDYKLYIDQLCSFFKIVGININTVPVLDVARPFTNSVLKNRSFSRNPKIVSLLGKFCIDLYTKNKIGTVIKHIPGHGLAKSDSHFKLPIVLASKKDLINKDFLPFKNSKSSFAMTAHILYKAFDSIYPATHSDLIINNVIRKSINFKGILISDDISMKALKNKLDYNALKSLEAGCNLVLHCNGKFNEMIKLLKILPRIDKFTQKKTSDFYKFIR